VAGGAKKQKLPEASETGVKKRDVSALPLRFSFKLFDPSDPAVCPPTFENGYVQSLMDRLKSLSTWTVGEFLIPKGKAVRNHVIDWAGTARPDGFPNLNEQLQAYAAHQFSISANDRGRVHGLLIDDTFHVIWLDQDHAVYPRKS
jgi:hypothetical protein